MALSLLHIFYKCFVDIRHWFLCMKHVRVNKNYNPSLFCSVPHADPASTKSLLLIRKIHRRIQLWLRLMMLLEVFSKIFKRNFTFVQSQDWSISHWISITLGVVRFTKLFMNKLLLEKMLTVLCIKIVYYIIWLLLLLISFRLIGVV